MNNWRKKRIIEFVNEKRKEKKKKIEKEVDSSKIYAPVENFEPFFFEKNTRYLYICYYYLKNSIFMQRLQRKKLLGRNQRNRVVVGKQKRVYNYIIRIT